MKRDGKSANNKYFFFRFCCIVPVTSVGEIGAHCMNTGRLLWLLRINVPTNCTHLSYLFVPMASISSMKTMEGACSSATLKSSRTSLGPSPRYFWISSEPTTLRNVADVWLATALASRVLPINHNMSCQHNQWFSPHQSTGSFYLG